MTKASGLLALAERDKPEGRAVSSLTRLEKAFLKRRRCGFCDAGMLGNSCYAMTGKYVLPAIKGVRRKAETIDLGKSCDMDLQRARCLATYKPRPLSHAESLATGGRG